MAKNTPLVYVLGMWRQTNMAAYSVNNKQNTLLSLYMHTYLLWWQKDGHSMRVVRCTCMLKYKLHITFEHHVSKR